MTIELNSAEALDIASFKAGFKDYDDLSPELQEALMEHFMPMMPYGTAKARTGDPIEWIIEHVQTMSAADYDATFLAVEPIVGVAKAAGKTLADVMPAEFNRDYHDVEAFKYRGIAVMSEHHELRWPGHHKNVHFWVKLANGKAVGWNENPGRGWSFPTVNLKG